ncbi:MAG: NUDIX domain-containing protein [Bacteroidales bacterium]
MKTVYNGFLKIKHREHAGKTYEVMDRGNSVTVLLVRLGSGFDTDEFYIGRQYRAGANGYIYTNVAGMIDEGEMPFQAAHREAMEEAGADGNLIHLYTGYPSAGGSTEKTFQYVMFVASMTAPTDLEEGITWEWIKGEELIHMADHGALNSMQTYNAVTAYYRNREKLLE